MMDDATLLQLLRAYRAVDHWPEEDPQRWSKMLDLRAAVENVLKAENLI